ncbi:Uncharacterised protein [Mycobacteroides abscessus subsp. abscessus]|nr:Uncharacterised protein [Mycobacteroides abscessus subsp. abscessus]
MRAALLAAIRPVLRSVTAASGAAARSARTRESTADRTRVDCAAVSRWGRSMARSFTDE